MPEARPLQTYSTLLEDRRIIEAAAEAREPPSLVVHLLEKEWSIRPGRNQNVNGPGGRRFSYSQPVSGLLDDIQARRIPTEFTDIFKKADIKFFEGCLLVEMHDSRPTKGGPTKNLETRVDKYVLRPTEESLWADIRSIVDSKQGWGDKEALELEARIVLSTAPPLCLDPSPSVNRMANVIARSGADPSMTSFKRKQSEDIEDDVETIKRRKLVQMMNPRFGKPFEAKFPILAAQQAARNKAEEGPPASATKATAPPVRQIPNQGGVNLANMPSQVAQLALQSNAQAAAIARQRLAGLGVTQVPQDAQQAAILQRKTFLARQQQQIAMAQAAVRNANNASAAAAAAAASNAPQAPANDNGNAAPVIKTEQDSMTQMHSLKNNNAPFPLNMPPVAKRATNNAAPPSSSPPKASSAIPPNSTPQHTTQSLQMSDSQQPSVNAASASQTPRPTPATPQVLPQNTLGTSVPQGNAGQQPGMITNPAQLASYHQGLINGQQNQMHSIVQGNPGYPTAVNPGMRQIYPGVANNYPMGVTVAGRAQMLQQQMGVGQMNSVQQQMMMQNAYPMNMGGFPQATQGMHPNMQQQILQMQQMQQNAVAAVAAGTMYAAAAANNVNMQNPTAQAQMMAMNQSIWMRVDANMSRMTPQAISDMVTRAPEHVKQSTEWANSNDREKARLTMFHLLRQKILTDRRQAIVNAAAANNQQQ